MRFVILRHADPGRPAGPVPPLRPAQGIAVHDSITLAPPAEAVRVTFTDGGPQEAPGSILATGPALAGLAMIEADSRDDAVAWLSAQPDGSAFELRETGCANGLAGVEPGAPATRARYLVVVRADADTEAERAPPAERLQRMGARNDEAVRQGRLLAADGLRSTARGVRVTVQSGRARVIDGPFAEAKELIAGFWLVQAAALAEVVAWVRDYPYAQARPEVEIRRVV
jgi:hypothetical protein